MVVHGGPSMVATNHPNIRQHYAHRAPHLIACAPDIFFLPAVVLVPPPREMWSLSPRTFPRRFCNFAIFRLRHAISGCSRHAAAPSSDDFSPGSQGCHFEVLPQHKQQQTPPHPRRKGGQVEPPPALTHTRHGGTRSGAHMLADACSVVPQIGHPEIHLALMAP